jgi:hypothetical protein
VRKLLLIFVVLVFALSGCGDGKGKYEAVPHAAHAAAN